MSNNDATMVLAGWAAATAAFGAGVSAVLLGGFAPGGPVIEVSAIGAVLLTASRFAIPRLRRRLEETVHSSINGVTSPTNVAPAWLGPVLAWGAAAAMVVIVCTFALVMSGNWGPYYPTLPLLVGLLALGWSVASLGRTLGRVQRHVTDERAARSGAASSVQLYGAAALGAATPPEATELLPDEAVYAWVPVQFSRLQNGSWTPLASAMAALTAHRVIVDDGRTELSFWWDGMVNATRLPSTEWTIQYEEGGLHITGDEPLAAYISSIVGRQASTT